MTRAHALALIWRTPSYKRHILKDGRRALLVQRGVGHFHVPLTELTDQDIANNLPCESLSASMKQRICRSGQ